MPVRTPDPDPNDRDDDGIPRDPLGGEGFGPGGQDGRSGRDGRPLGDGSFGSPTPDSASNPGWLSDIELAEISVIAVDVGPGLFTGMRVGLAAGKALAHALRVPTINVSAMQLTLRTRKPVTAAVVNEALAEAAALEFKGILGYTEEPLASCDFNHDPHSGIVDAGQTRVAGDLINVLTWFDNEWGYANRMLDVLACWSALAR